MGTMKQTAPIFSLHGIIGKAFSGLVDVQLAKREGRNNFSALRIISLEVVDYETIKKEVWFLNWLSHPNLASIEESVTVGFDVYIFSSYYDLVFSSAGSVLHIIQTHCKYGLPEKAIAQILKNLLLAVQYLHGQKIVHRSIRCSHVLLASNGQVKLSGLRNCAFLKHNHLTGAKNVLHDFNEDLVEGLLWLAPEVLKQDLNGYGLLSDVYSIGITLCEMANGFPPFFDMDRLQMLYEKSKGTSPRLLDCTTLVEDENFVSNQNQRRNRRFTEHFHAFANICLKPSPEHRLPILKLLSHTFVRSIKKNRSFLSLIPNISPVHKDKAEMMPEVNASRSHSPAALSWRFEN
ncbi:unnamed protein product [Dracunculus medinensis]|uniref:Protein kinase domain-containing protein n=1 Tax=Dracunculus medinensis TaxID=318479 RepID=A0A0N4UEE3_DRAME|nr:unnamed protein product [Dracunculus medinensis]